MTATLSFYTISLYNSNLKGLRDKNFKSKPKLTFLTVRSLPRATVWHLSFHVAFGKQDAQRERHSLRWPWHQTAEWNKKWRRRKRRGNSGGELRNKCLLRVRWRKKEGAWEGGSNCVRVLGTHASACSAHEVDGDWAIKGIIIILLRGPIDGDANRDKSIQPVSLPFIIVRTTAGALPVSPQNPPSVSLFLQIPPSYTVYFTMEPIYNDARKIKPRQTEANATLMETFYFGGEWVAGGSMVFFAFQMLAGKWAVIWVSMWAQEETAGASQHTTTLYSSANRNPWTPIQANFSFCACLCVCTVLCLSADWFPVGACMFACMSRPLRSLSRRTVLSTERRVSALVSRQMYPPACPLALTVSP